MLVRKVIRVQGRVQGVCFRYFTVDEATRLGLNGTVANLPDGSVETVVEGEEGEVRNLIDRLRAGPPASRVDNLEVKDEKPRGEQDGFRIIYVR